MHIQKISSNFKREIPNYPQTLKFSIKSLFHEKSLKSPKRIVYDFHVFLAKEFPVTRDLHIFLVLYSDSEMLIS